MRKPFAILLLAAMTAMAANAQRFAVKPHADITLGKAVNYSTGMEMNPEVSSNEFGVDFGYTFFNKSKNSLEANIGFGYRYLDTRLMAGDFGYSYSAPASADVDGNPYTRFCEISDLEQKINIGYLTLPVYLRYAYRCTDWMEVHALVGVRLGFKVSSSAGSQSGSVDSYGIFPEYDDLVIDAPYLDDFGKVNLADKRIGEPEANAVLASVMIGAGLDFRIYGPLWVNLGLRYDIGFSDVFAKGTDFSKPTAENAPVTYTVAEGTRVRALSDYITGGKLSPLSLNIGISLRF